MTDNLRVRLGKFSFSLVDKTDADGVARRFMAHPFSPDKPLLVETFRRAVEMTDRVLLQNASIVAQVRPIAVATGCFERFEYGISVARRAL